MSYPTTPAYDAAVASDDQVIAFRADLYTAGMVDLVASDLEVTGGSITVDRTAATRRSCAVNIADDTGALIRTFTGSNRAQPGPLEMVVSRGFRYPNGKQDLIPQGVFRVSRSSVVDTGEPTLAVTGYDRARTVARHKLTTSYLVPGGVRYIDQAVALVDFCLPFDVPVTRVVEAVDPTTTRTSFTYLEQDDPWQRAGELVATVGCEIYFDLDGSLRIRDIPDPTVDQPVFEFLDGENSVMISLQHDLDDEPGYNGVVYSGDSSANTDVIPRAIVFDSDPTSPTYWFGNYGQVPEFISDPQIGTNAQAAIAAAGRLKSRIGLTETFVLATVPNPALDVSDVVRVRRAASGIDANVLIESMTIPLDVVTAATLTCRSRRVVA
jgi:hypothetical protein